MNLEILLYQNKLELTTEMEQRKSMDWLIPEPDLLEDHVVASVKHATQGIV